MSPRLIDALQLPASARIDRRVTKALLSERGARTAVDRRRIREELDELHWVAALKPAFIGVPEYRDEARSYEEIAVLAMTTRAGRPEALATLVHRAVPYPVVLVGAHAGAWSLSLAHKRAAQNEAGRTVLDGEPLFVEVADGALSSAAEAAFFAALALDRQPLSSMLALYQGWRHAAEALQIACVTGTFAVSGSASVAASRREALETCVRLEKELSTRRRAAAKEKQLARQVSQNLDIKRLEAALAAARAALTA